MAGGDTPESPDSLPLDRRRRLSRNVVHDSRYSGHLVDDAMRDAVEKFVGQARPARGHEINGLDRTQCNHIVIAPPVSHHAYRSHRQEHGERLADLVVKAVPAQLLDENGVRASQQIGVRLMNLTQDPHSETGAW